MNDEPWFVDTNVLALIVESALEAGAEVLVTEDLQQGQTFAGMRVLDPFGEDATATA